MTETLNIRIALLGLNEVSKGINGIGDRMRSVVAGLSAIGAAVAGSAIVREFAAINGEIAKTATEAEKFGVSTEFLSSFQYALRATGVEQSKLAEAMKGYVEKAQSQGRVIGDLSAELMRQADIFSRMPDGPQKTAMAMNLFGEAGIALIPVLNKGEDGLRELTDEARRFGIVVDGDAAKAAKDLRLDMERLGAMAKGLKFELVQGVTPAITEFSKVMLAALTANADGKGISGGWDILRDAVRTTTESIAEFWIVMTQAGGSFYGTLWETLDPVKAMDEAWKDGVNAIAAYKQRLEELRRPAEDVNKNLTETAAAVGAINYQSRNQAIQRTLAEVGVIDGQSAASRMSDAQQRQEQRNRLLQREAILKREIAIIDSVKLDESAFENAQGEIVQNEQAVAQLEKRVSLMREQATVQAELNQLGASETTMVWSQTMLDLQNQWGSWAAQIAATFSNVFNTGISSISSNLTGVIMRTQSWGQALANIGTTILSTVINAIIEMGVRWVATQILMATAGKAIQAASVSAMIPIAAAQAAVWASPATLATIASYGGAAAASPGFIAAAQGIVLGKALSGFAEGGYTGNLGTSTPAGIVHGREFVMSAPATASIGVDALEAMNTTGAVPQSAGGREQRIVIVSDERTARDLEQDPEFETVVVNLMKRNWRSGT